jgi:hypothetical protein
MTTTSALIWKQDAANETTDLIKKETNPGMTVNVLASFLRRTVHARILNLHLVFMNGQWLDLHVI